MQSIGDFFENIKKINLTNPKLLNVSLLFLSLELANPSYASIE